MMVTRILDYEPYQRSALPNLQVINFNEWDAESLDSYAERLTASLGAPRRALETMLIDGDAAGYRSRPLPLIPRSDAPWSSDYASRLALLAARPEVRRLGLSSLSSLIASNGALRGRFAWCCDCLRESHMGSRPHFVPLVWWLQAVEACQVHQTVLQKNCWNCNAFVRAGHPLRYPFQICRECAVPLFKGRGIGDYSCASEAQVEIAKLVGDGLAELRRMKDGIKLQAPRIAPVIDAAVRNGFATGVNDFLRRSGISKGTYSIMLSGEPVSLNSWVRAATAANVSLAGLFAANLWSGKYSERLNAGDFSLDPRSKKREIRWDEIKELAESQIKSKTCSSFPAFCRKAAVDPSQALGVLGPLAMRYREAAAKLASDRASLATEKLAHQLVELAERMKSESVRLSARALARASGYGHTAPTFVHAYRKAAAKLRLAPYLGSARVPLEAKQ